MASKREVVVATENYLRSKGYNNSTGKYDRVIMGVKSLLGETLLTYGSPEFERAIQQETERMLKKYVKDSAMEYDPIMCMMVPKKAEDAKTKDQRTVDFSSSDAKKVFDYIDRQVTKDMNDYPREIERAKTPDDCERLNNAIRSSLDNAVDEYIQIWNEVGLYAQKRKNEIVDRYGKLMSQAFKKYNELKARE